MNIKSCKYCNKDMPSGYILQHQREHEKEIRLNKLLSWEQK